MAARSQTRKAIKPVRNHIKILVIDDDESVCNTVKTLLQRNGFQVRATCSPRKGVQLASQESFHIALIDLKMQEMDGLEVTMRITEADHYIACMLTTASPNLDTASAALRAGCKDYLTKPFHIEELMARVNALMRRSAGHARPRIQLGPVTVDLSSQRVWLRGEEIELTTFEYKVLNYLVMHPGEVVTKTDLSEHIYEEDADRDCNVIEVFIGRLRRKIDPDGTLNPIETLRGRGYRLALEPDQ